MKGNIDGMTFSRKYSQFNNEKNAEYIKMCMEVINEGLEISNKPGIKTFMWHHELDLPTDFGKVFPEVLNENGDIEVSHPLITDYLKNKILDFFDAYPKMDGIILTLHETKIPLLKLKNQKLDKIERVKLVTKTLYDTCNLLGKELVVRPFASQEQDQEMMLKAFAEISTDIIVMDKWTKFDWSLSLPDNDFFGKIKENPFIVETDIFGEYFGKGRLPIMFKEHIVHKYQHCQSYSNSGFVNRIDRNYQNPFGSVNEVNLVVMHALLNNLDVDEEVKNFFKEKYPNAYQEVYEIMLETEENQKMIFYLDGYYFTQGSYFPNVNHSKNHFFFEIMRDKEQIASNEWFIPVGWQRTSLDNIIKEKEIAVVKAGELLNRITALKDKIEESEYKKLYVKFKNLDYVAKLWHELTYILYNATKYFEKHDKVYKKKLFKNCRNLNKLNSLGKKELGLEYYNYYGARGYTNSVPEFGGDFVKSLKANLKAEEKTYKKLVKQNDLIDFIICGGISESHKLQKEVNFSDSVLINGNICRIPGNKRGAEWSRINAHGWFSYEIATKENCLNQIDIVMGSSSNYINVQINIDGKIHKIKQPITGKQTFSFDCLPTKNAIRIQFDRVDSATPLIYTITSKEK